MNDNSIDVYTPRTPESSRETLSPSEVHQQEVDRDVKKLDSDRCLAENRLSCLGDIYSFAGETPPRSVEDSLREKAEATDTTPEAIRQVDPEESIRRQAESLSHEYTAPDTIEGDIFRSLGMDEGEVLVVNEIKEALLQGGVVPPEFEGMIPYLGERLNEAGARRVRDLVVDKYGRIPGIGEFSPQDAIQFADQHVKAQAIYDAFKMAKERTWLSQKVNGLSELLTGKDLVDYGKVGQYLDKLENGELLTQEEMEKLVAKAESLNDSIKREMYLRVAQDSVERMIPGVNIAKDGFTADALGADALNAIALGAWGVSRGVDAVRRLSQTGQKIAQATVAANMGMTVYGMKKGVDDVEAGIKEHEGGLVARGFAELVMGAVGSLANARVLGELGAMGNEIPVGLSVKDVMDPRNRPKEARSLISYLGRVNRADLERIERDYPEFREMAKKARISKEYHDYALSQGRNISQAERDTIKKTFEAWDPKITEATPEQTERFLQNIGSEMTQALTQVVDLFVDEKGQPLEHYGVIGSLSIDVEGIPRDDVDVNFALPHAHIVERNLKRGVGQEKYFRAIKDENKKIIGYEPGYDSGTLPNGTPTFAFWVKVIGEDGQVKMKDAELFGEGIRHTDGKTIGITHISALPDVRVIRHQVPTREGQIIPVNIQSPEGAKNQYGYNFMTEFEQDSMEGFRAFIKDKKPPKAKDLMRLEKFRLLGAKDVDSMIGILEATAKRYDKPTVDPELKKIFAPENMKAAIGLLRQTKAEYEKAGPIEGMRVTDRTEAERSLQDFPTFFKSLDRSKLSLEVASRELKSARSIEDLEEPFRVLQENLGQYENMNAFLRETKPPEGILHFMATERFFSDHVRVFSQELEKKTKILSTREADPELLKNVQKIQRRARKYTKHKILSVLK